jgi:hypothetical protein
MMSVFHTPGLYLRNPRGGVDDVAAMRAAGFRTIALNVRDHTIAEWELIRSRAAVADVTCLPWARCLTETEVANLCALGRHEFDGRVLVNCEDELFGDPPDVTLACIERETRGLDAALSMLPWAGDLNLAIVRRLHMHLGLFPQERPDPLGPHKQPRDDRVHAFKRGALRVDYMLGVHDLTPDAFPARQGAYWVYVADDVPPAQKYARWAPETPPALPIPFTGPLYGPSRPDKGGGKRTKTARALKIACHRAGTGDFPQPNGVYSAALEKALAHLQRQFGILPTGQYGRGTYELLKTLLSVTPGTGYALGPAAVALIQADAA